jgi:hypothetical protein
MKALVTQSNYIPWKGYFDNIARCDVWVIYDDMQFTRRDWRNRNYVKTPNGLKWLTVPVEVTGKFHQKINETVVAERDWNINHWKQLEQLYRKAPCYGEVSPWVRDLYMSATHTHLTEINLHFARAILQFLGIRAEIKDSREFNLADGKTERLVSICRDLAATTYLTGPAAKDYMEEEQFTKNGIDVVYFDYGGYPEYPQLHPPFEHGVTILDLIFNVGSQARRFLKYFS